MINWQTLLKLESNDPDLSFDIFYSKLTELVNENVPLKQITKKQLKRQSKPWVTKGILKSMSKRDIFLKKSINAKGADRKSDLYKKYKSYRNSIVNLLKLSKKLHYQDFFINFNNTKKTWEGINEIINKKNSKSEQNIILKDGPNIITDPQSISNNFNKFFTTIAEEIQQEIPKIGNFEKFVKNNTSPNSFFFSPVSKSEILKTFKSIDHSKSTGEFSIPKQIFDCISDPLAGILCQLINLTFKTGIFPKALKTVKVIPIFKNKGSNQEVDNYRPISLLSNIDKIFEKLVYSRLISFLDTHNILSNRQFGFRKKHSTKLALISLTEEIRRALDAGNFSCGVFIDLKKAFDTVNHDILLRKMELYGIRGIANQWFRSYLSNRTQFVSYSGSKSSFRNILFGVPQGSVLGPLLFLIYINDLCNAMKYSKTSLFADDTSIVYSDLSLKNVENNINEDLNNLYIWLCANKISLNITKTKVLLFRNAHKVINYDLNITINNKTLKLSESVKYLGVTLDHFLNWKLHIKNLCSKLSSANGAISRLRYYVPNSTLIQIYYALFFSHLNYACQIWGQIDNQGLQRILMLQKKCVRLMTFSDYHAHSNPLFVNLNILKIHDLVKLSNVNLIHDILNSNCPARVSTIFSLDFYQHDYTTRGKNINLLSRPYARTTTYGIKSVTYNSIVLWNNFQKSVPNITLSEIKKRRLSTLYRNFLISQYIT